MTFQSTSTLRHRTAGRLPLIAAAAGIALIAGVIGARVTPGTDEQVSVGVSQPSVTLTSPVSAPRAGAGLATDAGGAGSVSVYVVATESEAGLSQAAINEADRHRVQFGLPLFNARVVVANTAAASDGLAGTIAEWDAMRNSLGMSPVTLVDLRGR